MWLVDEEIEALCLDRPPLVAPYDPACLNPHSLDVRLGTRLLREERVGDEYLAAPVRWACRHWEEVDISGATKEQPYWLFPREFFLGETLERFWLPDTVGAQFFLKSSRAREGYGHSLAGFCDAGWCDSVLTLELHAHSAHTPLPLYPGLRIGQIAFTRLARAPRRSYAVTGRYNGDTAVQTSKG